MCVCVRESDSKGEIYELNKRKLGPQLTCNQHKVKKTNTSRQLILSKPFSPTTPLPTIIIIPNV